MAAGFLLIYLGIAGAWTLLGVLLGFALSKNNRKKGAVIGAIVGIVLGGTFASVASFDGPSPREGLPVVAE